MPNLLLLFDKMSINSESQQHRTSPPNNHTEVNGFDSIATFKYSNSENLQIKGNHLVNVVINFLDESKTVFKIQVGFFIVKFGF